MKEQVAISMAGLMLLTAGCGNNQEKGMFGMFGAERETPFEKEEILSIVMEKNVHNQLQPISRPVLYDGGFFASADFIYWRADEDGLAYATASNGDIKYPSKKWSPGFRVGAGYTFACEDFWQLSAEWTHFNTHQSGSTTASGVLVTPWWGDVNLGAVATSASVRWSLRYNVYDLSLGRDYFVAKRLSVHPFVGLRGATIDQNYHASYATTIPTSFRAKTDFWGVGAHVGSSLEWWLASSFSMVGNFGGSLLYGNFHIHQNNGLKQELHETTGSVNLEAMLGLKWQRYFYANKYRLAITAGYEWNEWFSQNRMVKTASLTQDSGNLMLQGLKLQARWDF